jgi:mono/diheme cytochrome c family protein
MDGTIAELSANANANTNSSVQVATVTLPAGAADMAKGRSVYTQYCLACHGDRGTGGHGGGMTLVNIAGDVQKLADTAWAGRNGMPPFRGMLTPEQLRDVSNYISAELF